MIEALKSESVKAKIRHWIQLPLVANSAIHKEVMCLSLTRLTCLPVCCFSLRVPSDLHLILIGTNCHSCLSKEQIFSNPNYSVRISIHGGNWQTVLCWSSLLTPQEIRTSSIGISSLQGMLVSPDTL